MRRDACSPPTGKVGMTFWGSFDRMGLLPYFLAIIEHSPPSHQTATTSIGDTASVAEHMLSSTGFEVQQPGAVEVVNEWPDVDTAVRALAAAGPAIPAIESIGYDDVLRRAPRHRHAAARCAHRCAHRLRTRMGDRPTELTPQSLPRTQGDSDPTEIARQQKSRCCCNGSACDYVGDGGRI